MVLGFALGGLRQYRWRKTAGTAERLLASSSLVKLLTSVLGRETNSDRANHLARTSPSFEEQPPPWRNTLRQRMCYWETNVTRENKGTSAAGRAQGLTLPCPTSDCIALKQAFCLRRSLSCDCSAEPPLLFGRIERVQFCLEVLPLRLSCDGPSDRDRERHTHRHTQTQTQTERKRPSVQCDM